MGMTFEESLNNLIELQKDYQQFHNDVWHDPKEYGITAESLRIGIDTMRKYQQLQADYEARLKADMVAMLTEIQLEIEESENCGKAFHLGLQMASNIIQQKINALKGEQAAG